MWLSIIKPKLILIDDFEMATHFSLIRPFIKLLIRDLNSQIVITTHSIDVLNSTVNLYREGILGASDTKVILLIRDKGDTIRVNHVNIHDVYTLISAGHDPRKIMEVLGL